MRRRALTLSTIAMLTWASASPLADNVKLRSGQSVTGNFMSADVKIVRLMLDNGKVAEFAVSDITAVEFSPRKTPPPAAPDPSKAPQPITVPAGSPTIDLYREASPTVSLSPNAVGPVGGSQPHENMQPFLCISFIISLFGIFPSQT